MDPRIPLVSANRRGGEDDARPRTLLPKAGGEVRDLMGTYIGNRVVLAFDNQDGLKEVQPTSMHLVPEREVCLGRSERIQLVSRDELDSRKSLENVLAEVLA